MPTRVVQSSSGSKQRGWRERAGVLALAVGIAGVIGAYVLSNRAASGGDAMRGLLPYQTLARSLPEADQQIYRALRQAEAAAETARGRTSAWPEPARLASQGLAPFAGSSNGYRWSRLQQSGIVNYFGEPRDPAQPAWLLEIQEPEPGTLPDTAPNDDEHHRLPDGTVLHIYIWMHRLGGQVPVGFTRQPENSGWTQVFSEAPNPVYYNRR
jgi:hypothetical protein